eukprot:6415435-Heterocapsa_arctica.AAC.1
MESGVQQGCPLSPLLFFLVADLLLRRLNLLFIEPDDSKRALLRAFADDTAMVIPHFHKVADGVLATFRDYAVMSGLKLNVSKTVIIPLWPLCMDAFRRTVLRDSFPAWRG